MRGQRLRLLLLPRLWVFYVWGSGGFGFRFAALHVCACALIGLHFPYVTTAQYLFQYMIMPETTCFEMLEEMLEDISAG